VPCLYSSDTLSLLLDLSSCSAIRSAVKCNCATVDFVRTDIQHVSGTAFVVEMLITAVLVLVVFAAAADSNNTPSVKDIQHVSGTAVAVEMLITAVLVLVVFAAAADSNNTGNVAVTADVACFRDCCCYVDHCSVGAGCICCSCRL
jgi:glycerol uptake facilitator-like aquaporin